MLIKLTVGIIFIFASLLAQEDSKISQYETFVKEISMKYAPDKRVAIFDINLEMIDGKLNLSGITNLEDAKMELIEKIKLSNMDYHDQINLLPGDNLGDRIYGIVNLSVANIRTKPKHPAELSTQALLGTPVKVLDYNDYFYRVQTPDEYISWVDPDGIFRVNKEDLDTWIAAPKVMFINEYGFCFTEPNVDGGRVSDLVMGNLLILENELDEFYKVSFPDGRSGYVRKNESVKYDEWLELLNSNEESITSFAKTLMGIPYLWGGTSSKGMDCSGFTKTVYFMNGIILPRDASQQVHTGELVDTEENFNNLRPGDLLFFGRKATEDKKERITHVGIYIGDMEYIHASGRVKINSFDRDAENFSEYRLNGFIRAKRILTSIDENGISSIKNHKYYSGDF
jgi:hypothetical protein